MAFYCLTMLSMALELARDDPAYEDVASKFFEHFVAIADAMNTLGGNGLWDEADGFYYDQLRVDDSHLPHARALDGGLMPLIAVEVLETAIIDRLPGLSQAHGVVPGEPPGSDATRSPTWSQDDVNGHTHRLLAIPSPERLLRVLRYMLDENEFLSPYGIRSLSKFHQRASLHAADRRRRAARGL